jgi:preprotein translocase SecE subunit
MAVAEKPAPKTPVQNPAQQLALASFAGAAFLLAVFFVVFSGIPTLWEHTLAIDDSIVNPFLATAIIMILSVASGIGLFIVGHRLEASHPLRGQRAGAVIGALLAFFIFVIVVDRIGGSLAYRDVEPFVTWSVIAALGGGLLFLTWWVYTRPGFGKYLVGLEEKGWFQASSFKYNQGQRIRRITLIALLVIIGAGIYSAVQQNTFGRGAWETLLPGTDFALVVLYNVEYTMPLLLFAGLGWFAWRLVNWPAFADFLIATEAEMNKVSWTTRKRLYQDTIVVLVTMLLFTVFLFVVDILWIQLLRLPGVLQIDPQKAKQQQMGPTDW